jgi:hypothetical protein|tara:strand:- start:704 stop:859 length:156 start_codon:yes stop_codon:yes gene_type:complete
MLEKTVEERYWKDFAEGMPLKKYGSERTLKQWMLTQEQVYFDIILKPASRK